MRGRARPQEPGVTDTDPRPRSRHISFAELGTRYGIFVAWFAVILAFSLAKPSLFLTTANFENIFGSQAILLILTLGAILPLSAGEFDFSVAGVLSVSLMLVGQFNVVYHWAIGPAVLVTLAAGVAVGVLNAILVVSLRVNSVPVTLGMGTLLLGVTLGINEQAIPGISNVLVSAASTQVLGLQLVFYYGLALTIGVWYLFRYTPLGRYLYIVGANAEVARLAGIRVDRLRAATFVASSLIAAFAGVILAGVLGASDPNTGSSYLLPAFAAAFLGATAITPGRFNAWGTFVAVYFLITGITGLEIVGVTGWIEQVFYGGALIVAVTISRLASRGGRP